jgi:hypothetical protein
MKTLMNATRRGHFMLSRLVTATVFSAVVAVVSMTLPVGAQGQPGAWTPPRTPDGHPDLQGFFNVATITPVERPAIYGSRLILTNEEAAALERGEAERDQKLAEPSAAPRRNASRRPWGVRSQIPMRRTSSGCSRAGVEPSAATTTSGLRPGRR